LDAGLQRAAEKELARQIEAAESGKLGRLAVEKSNGDPEECLEGLFVALDAHTGDVRALVGGRDYALSEFDRVTQARRQPGSTFKAFVWAAAVQAGIPVSTLLDPAQLPPDYAPADGQVASDKPLNLREALRVSSNRAAVALGQRVGMAQVVDTAHSCGIGDAVIPPYPSSFLGAANVVPLELVAAFAPFANGGDRILPRFIDEVRSATGDVLLKNGVVTSPALQHGAAFIMSSLLADVVERGTGTAARACLPADLPGSSTGLSESGSMEARRWRPAGTRRRLRACAAPGPHRAHRRRACLLLWWRAARESHGERRAFRSRCIHGGPPDARVRHLPARREPGQRPLGPGTDQRSRPVRPGTDRRRLGSRGARARF